MTNEEAIKSLNTLRESINGVFDYNCRNQCAALDMAIKALEQQPSEDCISREVVEEITFQEPSYTDPYNILTEVREKVRALPPVTPQRPKGKWFETLNIAKGNYQCSICKHYADWFYKYCPNCGAEMSGGGEDKVND